MGGSRDNCVGVGGVGKCTVEWSVISMTCGSCEVENLVLALHKMEVVKFGNFKLNNDLACVIWVGKVKVERS
jgi:hypothetical protein